MVQNIKNYIKKAYNIDLISISPISNQYSSVYKVSTKSASYALLLYRPNKKPEDIRSELTVYKYLNSVREGDLSFPNPLEADLAIDELKLKGRFALLYDWVEHLPYGNDPYQKEQAFTSYCYLNNLMKGINYNDYSYTKTGALDGAFDSLSKNYTDLNFTKFSNDNIKSLLQDNLLSLKSTSSFVTDYYMQNKQQFKESEFQLIHNDLSPRNFGFREDKKVSFIMDFDLCKVSTWQYDLSWMIWRFCFDEKKSPEKNLEAINKAKLFFRERNYDIDLPLFLFLLLGRLILTLEGRLQNYEKDPLAGLTFVPSKIREINFLREYLM